MHEKTLLRFRPC